MLTYPLTTTPTNDLELAIALDKKYPSRIRLFLDCPPGTRAMLPRFGSEMQQFVPDSDRVIEAELLRLGLNQWCRADGETVEYSVAMLARRDGLAKLDIRFKP
jgi:hypothetical protein